MTKADPVLDWRATREALIARDGQFCHYCGNALRWSQDIEADCMVLYDSEWGRMLDEGHTERWRAITEQVATLRQRYSMQVDHKVPRSAGGSNRLSNLVLSCLQCNSRKGTLPYEEACWNIREKRETMYIPPVPGIQFAIVVRRTLAPTGEWTDWYCRKCQSSACPHAQTVTTHPDAVKRLWAQYQATERHYIARIQELFQQEFDALHVESSDAIGA